MVSKCRCGCGRDLAGNQRKWASEACRQKQARSVQRGQKAVARASAYLSGNRAAFSPGRLVEMRIVVDCGALQACGEEKISLGQQIQSVLASKHLSEVIQDELSWRIPGYEFDVTCQARP